MGKNIVQNIIIHNVNDIDFHSLSLKINEFHADMIERQLNKSNLTMEQKIKVIDKILINLHYRIKSE